MAKVLFPEPKMAVWDDGYLELTGDLNIILSERAGRLEAGAAERLMRVLAERGGNTVRLERIYPGEVPVGIGKPIFIGKDFVEMVAESDPSSSGGHVEGYRLSVGDSRIVLAGEDEAGTLYACETFKALLETRDGKLMAQKVTICDWPDYRYRGLYIESKWGPDLMTLEDWKGLIDFAASIKLNLLGVGIYGCWVIQYDNMITEFLLVPIKSYPDLATPKTIGYYSPGRAGEVTISYLPRMFVGDFFGDVVAYGKERNVTVRPHFNSLGHNTLIPRHYPQVSAKDAGGHPTGYGFCLSNPKTYEMVFRIYDEIIDRYLLPNGVHSFHMGMDEVYPLIGIDPKEPKRSVDPWCKCPECSRLSREELLVDYLLKLMGHLSEKGISQICLWNDQLSRHMNILGEEFVQKLDERGLKDKVVLEWWWYGLDPPKTIRPELGIERWVNPMTGYFFWMLNESYLKNIQLMTELGYQQGATGIEPYGAYDPAYHRNYYALSQWSWNRKTLDEAEGFRSSYARALARESSPDVIGAWEEFDKVIEPGPLRSLISCLVYYRYTYVNPSQPYPRNYLAECVELLFKQPADSRNKLGEVAAAAGNAYDGFSRAYAQALSSKTRDLLRNYAAEARRIRDVAREYLLIMDACEAYRRFRDEASPGKLREAITRLNEAIEIHDGMMAEMEGTKPQFLLPHLMRELTLMRKAFTEFRERLSRMHESLPDATSPGAYDIPPLELVLAKEA